jgi:lipoyl(octanoyl) transferase
MVPLAIDIKMSPLRKFYILPDRSLSAIENMADDHLLLNNFPYNNSPCFRHYKWQSPTHTFGYSQHWKHIYDETKNPEAIRRPTGGGIVKHGNDWTYSIVIPTAHPLCSMKASLSYLKIHECLAFSLKVIGHLVKLLPCKQGECDNTDHNKTPAICFQQPVTYDVISEKSSDKIAGAAQKRNKHGLLIQGTVDINGTDQDYDLLKIEFIKQLSKLLECDSHEADWPTFSDELRNEEIRRFSSDDWNKKR